MIIGNGIMVSIFGPRFILAGQVDFKDGREGENKIF